MDHPVADFYGFDFETEYLLFADSFEELPGVFIVYTEKSCLYIGTTEYLKTTLEEHENTRDWIKLSEGKDIYIAFHLEEDKSIQKDTQKYLYRKMNHLNHS